MPMKVQSHGCSPVAKHAVHDVDTSARTHRGGGRGVPQAVWNHAHNTSRGARLVEFTPVLVNGVSLPIERGLVRR
jgi:hypothetical protein